MTIIFGYEHRMHNVNAGTDLTHTAQSISVIANYYTLVQNTHHGPVEDKYFKV